MIYLDHNSTTPIDAKVVQRITECLNLQLANPSSQHQAGQKARRILEDEKTGILDRLSCQVTGNQTDRLIITSGGTESNNLALIGIAQYQRQIRPRHKIVVSSIEHPCVLGAADYLASVGFQIEYIDCDQNGRIRLDHLSDLVDESTIMVSLMLANHETGVIQPVAQAAEICRSKGVLVHSDASQAIGKIPVDFHGLGIDAMTISPHKFYGPRAVGGLVLKHDVELSPLLFGGFQQLAARPGTEDIALVSGMNRALELALDRIEEFAAIAQLRNRLESGLRENDDSVVINGNSVDRLSNTSNIAFIGRDRQALLMAADMNQIYFSTGSACASGSSEPSPVLMAMHLDRSVIESSVRLSLGHQNTIEEVDFCISKISMLAKSK